MNELLSDLHSVVSLKDHHGWKVIVRDAEIAHNAAASGWVDIYDPIVLQELRVKQLAARNILSLMEQYEARLREIQVDMIKEANPDLVVPLDVDNNIVDEEGTEEDNADIV